MLAHVRHAAGAPVHAALALHQLLVDEEAAQGGEVGMAPGDDAVHLRLLVTATGLEVLDQPAQHGEALLALDRDAGEAPRLVDEVLEHAVLGHRSGRSYTRRIGFLNLFARSSPHRKAAFGRSSDATASG